MLWTGALRIKARDIESVRARARAHIASRPRPRVLFDERRGTQRSEHTYQVSRLRRESHASPCSLKLSRLAVVMSRLTLAHKLEGGKSWAPAGPLCSAAPRPAELIIEPGVMRMRRTCV